MTPEHLLLSTDAANNTRTNSEAGQRAARVVRTPADTWLSLAVALGVVALLYIATFRGTITIADEIFYYGVTRSIVERGALQIDDLRWLQERVPSGVTGPDNHLYSKYGLAQSVIAVPGYWIGRSTSPKNQVGDFAGYSLGPAWAVRGVVATSLVISLAALLATALLARRLAASWASAAWIVTGAGLGTLLWPYAHTDYSEPLTAAALTAAVALAFGATASGRLALSALAGLALGVTIAARPMNVVVVPIILGYLVWRWPGRPARILALIAAALPIAVSCLTLLWYNWYRLGSAFDFAYQREGFTHPVVAGLIAFLASPGKSLFLFSPVLLLAFLGLPRMLRRARAETVTLLVLAGVYILLYSAWWSWEGGWSWGPRFLLPIIPALMVLALPTVERLPWWGIAVIVLASAPLPMLGALADPAPTLYLILAELGLEASYIWSLSSSYVLAHAQRIVSGHSDALALGTLDGSSALGLIIALLFLGVGLVALATRCHGGWRRYALWPGALGLWALVVVVGGVVLTLPRPAEDFSARSPYARVAALIAQHGTADARLVYSSFDAFYSGYPMLKDKPHLVVPDDWQQQPDLTRQRLLAFAHPGASTWLIQDPGRSAADQIAFGEDTLRTYGVVVFDQWIEPLRLVGFARPDTVYDPDRAVKKDVHFGEALALDAHAAISEAVSTPATLRIVTRWRTLSSAGKPLKLFVHLADPSLRPVRQIDKELRVVGDPARRAPGSVFLDVADLFLDAAVPAGEYRLLLGLYESPTGPRLALRPAAADYVELGRVKVDPFSPP